MTTANATPIPRALSLIAIIFFAYATVVQYNDPNSALWYCIYGYCLVIACVTFLGRSLPVWSLVAPIVLYLGYLAALATGALHDPEQAQSASRMLAPEQSLEEIGLLICVAWMVFLLIRRGPATPQTS